MPPSEFPFLIEEGQVDHNFVGSHFGFLGETGVTPDPANAVSLPSKAFQKIRQVISALRLGGVFQSGNHLQTPVKQSRMGLVFGCAVARHDHQRQRLSLADPHLLDGPHGRAVRHALLLVFCVENLARKNLRASLRKLVQRLIRDLVR
jgi:hypothetical protein